MITILNILLIIILALFCIVLGFILFWLLTSFNFLKRFSSVFTKLALNTHEKVWNINSNIKLNNTWLENSKKFLIAKEKFDIENRLDKTSENLAKTIKISNTLFGNIFWVIKYLIAIIILVLIIWLASLIYVILKSF